jgi:cyclic pyranopterin phosphate synthase
MPETGVKFEARDKILTFEEIERFVRIAASLGVRKLRLTGGEPLVRKDLAKLVRKLAAIECIEDLALTTNGVLLADQAKELYDAGLRPLTLISTL